MLNLTGPIWEGPDTKPGRALASVAVEKDGRDLPPLIVRRVIRVGLVGTLVPVGCVLGVTLPTMQISVDPGRFLIGGVFLRDVVRAIEVSLGVPPESLQQGGQTRWGHRLTDTSTEFLDGHAKILRR
jgi:hypothetical protein